MTQCRMHLLGNPPTEAEMQTFEVAYFKHQGQTVLLVVVSPSFLAA
jgi:hypothetical protein